jgi:hypothetical protein
MEDERKRRKPEKKPLRRELSTQRLSFQRHIGRWFLPEAVLKHGKAHRIDLDARTGNDLEVSAEFRNRLAEGFARCGALYHQFESLFSFADRAHAVMDTAWA